MRAGERAVVGLLQLPPDVGGAEGRFRRQWGIREVLPYTAVEKLGRFGRALRCVGFGGFGLQVGRGAVDQRVAPRRLRADDAFVADPTGGRVVLLPGVGELGLLIGVFFFLVGIGEDADPGAV